MAVRRREGAPGAGRVRLPRSAYADPRVHRAFGSGGGRGHRRRREADVHVQRPRRPVGEHAPRGDRADGACLHRARAVDARAGHALVLHRADVPARARAARAPAPVPPGRRRALRPGRADRRRRDDRDAGDDADRLRAAPVGSGGHAQLPGRARGAARLSRGAGVFSLSARRQARRGLAAAARDQPAARARFEEPGGAGAGRERARPARPSGRRLEAALRAACVRR